MKLKNSIQALITLILIVAAVGLYKVGQVWPAWICVVVGIVVAVWGGTASGRTRSGRPRNPERTRSA